MTFKAKMEYLESIYGRYKKAPKKEKSVIFTEFCLNCNYHRKHAIRLLNNFKRFAKPKLKKRGRTFCDRTIKTYLAGSKPALL